MNTIQAYIFTFMRPTRLLHLSSVSRVIGIIYIKLFLGVMCITRDIEDFYIYAPYTRDIICIDLFLVFYVSCNRHHLH